MFTRISSLFQKFFPKISYSFSTPATAGRAVPAARSRCGVVCNKSARNAAMSRIKPRARHADRRSTLRRCLKQKCVCRGSVTNKTQSATCPPLGAPPAGGGCHAAALSKTKMRVPRQCLKQNSGRVLLAAGARVSRQRCKQNLRARHADRRSAASPPVGAINIPRQSRGFFIDGQSPLLLAARVTSRWYGLPAAKACYLPPVNGLFRSFPSSAVRPPDLLPTGAGCIPQFFLSFFPAVST